MKLPKLIVLAGLCIVFSCKTENTRQKEEAVQQPPPESSIEVTVMALQSKPFTYELVSNGKIQATQMVGLK